MCGLESELKKYQQIKIELLRMAKCIECCRESEKEMYQNICFEYSKELRKVKEIIDSVYNN